MRQFDVLPNPNPGSRSYAPFVVVLQSHHLAPLDTVPLAPIVNDARRTAAPVDVPVEFQGQSLVVVLAEMAGVPRRGLARPLGSMSRYQDEILRSCLRLLTGF